MGDGACVWFVGRPPTTARVVGTAREGEKMLPVRNAQQQTFGGYIERWGGEGENKGDIFNNQQRLEAVMEGVECYRWQKLGPVPI
jgi:hypothetical protein